MKSKSDPEFLNFAVKNISELFGYLATGRVNIKICRDITGLPDGLFGGPAPTCPTSRVGGK